MSVSEFDTHRSKAGKYSAEEWAARVDLACAYRLFFHLGWHSLIYNHITLRVPGPENHFLINPFGLMYREVTASNLLKIDLDGAKVEDSPYAVWEAGFIVHGAVHRHREDLKCVMHTHTVAGVAVSCQPDGLLAHDLQSATFLGQIAYHDLEGPAFDRSQLKRIADDLGDKSVMILRNHGLLVGGETIADAFHALSLLEHSCQVQLAIQSSGAPMTPLPPDVIRQSLAAKSGSSALVRANAKLQWAAMRRWMDDIDPSYAS